LSFHSALIASVFLTNQFSSAFPRPLSTIEAI
jgi:hypothetical protein